MLGAGCWQPTRQHREQKLPPNKNSQDLLLQGSERQQLGRITSPVPWAGETRNTIQESTLGNQLFSVLGFCILSGGCSRNRKKSGKKGQGTGGKHQASGPSWPCLSRVDFFFLNPKVKVFLFEMSIYIPESKKKKAAKLQAYICPQQRHRHSIRAAQGNILSPLPELPG